MHKQLDSTKNKNVNVAYQIEQNCQLLPSKTALTCEGKSFTYQALDELINRVANVLKRLGVERGDRVAVLLPNMPEFVTSYFAILKLAAIAVSINPTWQGDKVNYVLKDCTPKILITTEKLSQQIVSKKLPTLQQIVIVESNPSKGVSLPQLMTKVAPDFHSVEVEEQTPAAILYTSSISGFVRGVTLSHGNIVFSNQTYTFCSGIGSGDQLLLYSSLSHTFGQNAILNSGLSKGATIVLEGGFDPKRLLKIISAEAVTVLSGTPMFYQTLLKEDLSSYDLSKLRYCCSGVAPLLPEVAQQWQEVSGLVIYEVYGPSEALPCILYPPKLKHKLNSVGSPVDGVEVKIIRPDGTAAQIEEVGEVVVRGLNVMLGYWNHLEEMTQVIHDGWYHTGDLGRMDDEGYIYLVDRLKDVVNMDGLKVHPSEVEQLFTQLENLQDLDQHNEQQKSASRCLVPLQAKGSKLPFFCVPGVSGDPACLSKLVSYMSKEQPFYSFVAPGLDGKSLPVNRIPTLASIYLKELRQFQPEGPYLLGGHCFGAAVAFEMAHQLQHQGQDVPLLILTDAFPSVTDSDFVLDPNENKYKAYHTMTSQRVKATGSIENFVIDVVKELMQASWHYELHELSKTKIVLLRAKECNPLDVNLWFSKSRFKDPSWGWQQLSSEKVEVHFTPGDHVTMLADPHVKHLAEQLESKLLEFDINKKVSLF